MTFWTPQPGPQAAAAICPADKPFFGGSRGGGKSDCALGRHLNGAEKYGPHWNGLIVRRKYKEHNEMRRRIDEMIREGLPAERVGGDQQTNYVRFDNGAVIVLFAAMRLELVDSLQGHQYTEITIEEATTFPFIYQMVDKLNACLRSAHGVPCHMFFTGNPGGPGHNAVKEMFVTPSEPNKVFYDAGESKVFIPSFLDDNRILCENDPKYVGRLKAIKDVALRKAWLDGDWSVYIGQAFSFNPEYHVIDPILPIPISAPIYTTFDWGFGKPFSWAWWWVDNDGRLYRFAEWYGYDGTPNQGLRLADSEIAEGIKQREEAMTISGRSITRLAGPDCFSKKPDYNGGGQGKSTAEVLLENGIILTTGDPSRVLKIRQFRERLRIRRDDEGKVIEAPMVQIYRNCLQFIRTIPDLCMDDLKPEDIDTDQEDHIYDEACHIFMARPMTTTPTPKESSVQARTVQYVEGTTKVPPWEQHDSTTKYIDFGREAP